MESKILRGAFVFASIAGLLAAISLSADAEPVFRNDRLAVMRDFGPLTINPAEAKNIRLFVDPVRMVSASEGDQLRAIVLESLQTKLSIVTDKADANYLMQIIVQNFKNYAIGNTRGQPANGYILVSLCKFPIKDIPHDCENMTYFYFDEHWTLDLFREVFSLWTEATLRKTEE